jgi:hypothetical protein
MATSQYKPQVNDELYRTMCELGGGRFVGVQAGFNDRHGNPVEPLCYFNSPLTGSTLALPVSKVSSRTVAAHITKSNAQFEQYAEKAAGFVLANFARRAA